MKRFKIWINVLINFIFSFKGCNAKIMSAEETLNFSLKKQKAIIRLGDGEFNIMNGKSICYQDISEKLQQDMKKLVDKYMNNDKECKYLLCVPKYFMECSGFKLIKKRIYISSWAFSRRWFQKKFKQNITYGDAFCFSKDNKKMVDNFFSKFKNYNCIFVHNEEKYALYFKEKYGIKTTFVKIKNKNCYEDIDKTISEIKEQIKNEKGKNLVVVSAGPAGKIIVKELSEMGVYSIDTGHCWDDPLVM